MSSFDYLDLCRLCLVKDQVSVPIFEGDGDARQIFHKISFCLPVKVDREDKLPKKICDDCAYKVELCYQFYNTTANAEKQLLQWLGEVGLEDKQDYEQEVMNSDMMKQEPDNRINVTVLSSEEQSNNMEINMIDGMSLSLPIIMTNQQMPAVSMSSTDNLQNIQSVAGTSVQTTRRMQKDGGHEEIEDTEEDDNSEDECDVDEGMQVVKEESENSTSGSRSMEPTTFVNVALSCNEAGPSGLQQQKLGEISEMGIQQSSEGDTKTGLLSSSQIKTEHTEILKRTDQKSIPAEEPSDTKDKETEVSVKDKNRNNKESYVCKICNKHFRLKNLFEGHLVAHSDARPYQCDICNKSFKRTSTLAVHRRIHTRERNFICDVCGRAFIQASQLAMHQRRHFEKYICFCELCGKGFFTNAELHGHMNIKHGAKEHVCHHCGKSFPNNHTLARHANMHDPNFKPIKHQCEFCGKIFAYKNSLMVHVKSHTGENKYDCHLCGKSVSSRGSLQDHLRLHGGEKSLVCDVCGKAFHKRTTLVVHKRTHTGEKPYSCDTCGKSFTQHSTLVIHKRYHTGQRPYQCTVCTKSFVSRALLNVHNKAHVVVVQPT